MTEKRVWYWFWDLGERIKFTLDCGDMYIMRLDTGERNKPFLCKIVALVEEDLTVHFEDEEKKRLMIRTWIKFSS